jgi:Arc/MetJ-type ribon-helix-helix transcriptional regulator
MKLSVSLPGEDVAFLDAYASEQGLASRSAAVHRAVRLLRTAESAAAYESAWDEWAASADAALWETTASDGAPTGDGGPE